MTEPLLFHCCLRRTGYFKKLLTKSIYLVIILFGSCKDKGARIDFFPGTKLIKSEGYYLNGKPVDTFKSYFKNGKREFIEVYNKNGLLQGEARFFNDDGSLSEVVNYIEGKKEGVFTSYWWNGRIKVRGFFFNDRPMGDATYFDKFGRLKHYNFSNFSNEALMVCQYDTIGKVEGNDNLDYYFIDSISAVKGNLNLDTVKTMILVSHQPKTFLQLKIDNIGKGGKIIKTQDIDTKGQLVFFNNLVTKEVDTIKLVGTRYDSVLEKKRTFIIVRNDFRYGLK